MSEDLIGYAEMIDDAMRGVVRQTLIKISEEGLPGDHHCYISFRTSYPGASISPELRERYPEEMTIVLQHQYWNLLVEKNQFSLELSFGGKREKLVVPYDALTAYADPSIKFGLQFQDKEGYHSSDQGEFTSMLDQKIAENPDGEVQDTAQVIALDAFRKKGDK